MPRKSKLSAVEIAGLEEAEYTRRETRNSGFAKMKERDLGLGRLYDYNGGKSVVMDWRMDEDGIKDQLFKLRIGQAGDKCQHLLVLDAEQVRRHLRWV